MSPTIETYQILALMMIMIKKLLVCVIMMMAMIKLLVSSHHDDDHQIICGTSVPGRRTKWTARVTRSCPAKEWRWVGFKIFNSNIEFKVKDLKLGQGGKVGGHQNIDLNLK